MTRFGFNIRTQTGQRVDNIQIMAASMDDAERREQPVPGRIETADLRASSARVRMAALKDKIGTH